VRTVAIVGASANEVRPSFFVTKYLIDKGFEVYPINPGRAGGVILDRPVFAKLADVPVALDMVDVFRSSDAVPGIVGEALALSPLPKVLWMQLGVRHDAAAVQAEVAGIVVVMNRCPKIEYGRLSGEIGWTGVNSGLISARKPIMRTGVQNPDSPPSPFMPARKPDPATGARATPDLSDDVVRVRRCGPRRLAVRPAGVRQHLHPHHQSDAGRAGGARRGARRRHGGAGVASGHAAEFLVFHALMQPGDEFVASNKLYGGSINQFNHSYKNFGWNVKWADPDNLASIEAAIGRRKTKAIFIESIANPGGVITDIEAIAKIARRARVPLIVDNTLATPYLIKPFEHGADIIVHSATKFLGGHGNSLGGVIVDGGSFDWLADKRYPMLSEPRPEYNGMVLWARRSAISLSPSPAACSACAISARRLSPFNAFLILTGIETLPLRMQRHSDNALKVAEHLSQAIPRVSWVSYPGLPGDRYHALAQKYCPKGAGAVFTFGLKGGYDAGISLVKN
jgi:O-acetylhomoserine (thiol)-lyase